MTWGQGDKVQQRQTADSLGVNADVDRRAAAGLLMLGTFLGLLMGLAAAGRWIWFCVVLVLGFDGFLVALFRSAATVRRAR